MPHVSRRWTVVLALLVGACADSQPQASQADTSIAGGPDLPTGTAPGPDANPELPPIEPIDVVPEIVSVTPTVVDPLGGSHLRIEGDYLDTVKSVRIGGVAATHLTKLADGALNVTTAAIAEGSGYTVEVTAAGGEATWSGTIESWSPTSIPGARVFDAGVGLSGSATGPDAKPARSYEWSRLTSEVHPQWR